MISPVKIWRRQKVIRASLGKKGVIVSWTKIYTPPKEFKKSAPYYVVLVKFFTGGLMVGQLVDFLAEDEVQIGKPVIAVLRKTRDLDQDGVIAYGLKFKLI